MSQGHPVTKPHLKPAADRTPFYGFRVPHEIKELCKALKATSHAAFRKVLQLAVASAEGRTVVRADLCAIEKDGMTSEGVGILFSGVLRTLQLATRSSESALSADALKEDLVGLGIQKEFADDFALALFGPRRPSIVNSAVNSKPGLPSLKSMKWRVDVGISTSVLSRALEPVVLLELQLTDGSCRTLEMPVSKFHELRYNTAFVLKEMEDLEKRTILKIQD